MLASTSRSCLKRTRLRVTTSHLKELRVVDNCVHAIRNASSTTTTEPTTITPNARQQPASNLKTRPWSFTPDSSFQRMQTRTTLAQCNLQLGEFAANGRYINALQTVANMKERGIQPDVTTYTYLLQALAEGGLHLEARAAVDDMLALDLKPTRQIFNSLLHAQRYREISVSWPVLDLMEKFGVEPGADTYTYFINRFTADGNLEMAVQLTQIMQERNIVPELSAIHNVVTLAAHLGFPRLALDLSNAFERSSVRRLDSEVWMACLASSAEALYADGVCHCWAVVVQDMNITPGEGLCINVLNTAARHGIPDLATDVLRVLKSMGTKWAEHHFAPLVEAFCRSNRLEEALSSLSLMRQNGITPLLETTLPILNTFSEDVDAIDAVWNAIESIHKKGKPVDISALNLILKASVSARDLQRAVGAYKSFADYDAQPTLETFNLLLECCTIAGHRELGDHILADMKEARVKPNLRTFESMTLLCLTQDIYEDAFHYLEETKAAGLKPTSKVYEVLVKKCASVNDPRLGLALEEMKTAGFKPSAELRAHLKNTGDRRKYGADKVGQKPISGIDGAAQRFIETGGVDDFSQDGYVNTRS